VSLDEGRQIFDGLIEYPLPAKAGVKDYIFYCGDLKGFGVGAKKLFDKHWPAHVAKTANTLQDLMLALQAEVTSGGVTQIRELVLVAHANRNQLFLPVVPAGPDVDAAYGCVSAWSLAKLQTEIEGKFSSFGQAREAVVPHLVDDSWVTIRACNFGNSAEAMYALYSFFGGRANVYAPTKFMVFGDWAIKPGYQIESKFGVYDYLVKQHFLSSNEHTPKRQAAIVTELVDPESFAEPFQLATAQMIGGDPDQAAAYQQLLSGLYQYSLTPELTAAFVAEGHPLSASAQVVSANDTAIDLKTDPPGPRSVWYLRDSSFPDGAESIDLLYQVRDETDAGGTSTLEASAQLAVDSAYASIPVQLFFDDRDDYAFSGVVAKLAGYADAGPYADQEYKDVFNAIQALLDDDKWTDGTYDLTKAVNEGLKNNGFDELPDPLPTIQEDPNSANRWLILTAPVQLVALVGPEAAPDGSTLHSIVIGLDFDDDALQDHQKGVIEKRGRVPHTPGTEIASYLDGFTADQLASFMDYLRSAYRPAYAYYLAHAMAAIERKRDYLTWERAQPDFTDPLPKYLMLRPNENHDIDKVAYDFDFNDNWREVKQHSKYAATFHTDLFKEESLTDKLPLTVPYICGALPPDSIYFSRDELKAVQSQGFKPYFATSPGKTEFDPPSAPADQGCVDLRAALQKWKEMQDTNVSPAVQQQTLENMFGSDNVSAWERIHHLLDAAHLGTELWDITGKPHIEWKVALTEYLERKFEGELLGHAFKALGWFFEVESTITVPFELLMEGWETQEEASELWDARGQFTAIRQWCQALSNLTFQAPFPKELHIDIGGEDQAIDNWRLAQQIENPYSYILMVPPGFATELEAGYARAAVSFGRIGPQIVEQADKFITEQIGQWGLSPCAIDALNDADLFDLDSLRRTVIRSFAEAVRDSMPPV
jgi:hypothetical protein